ncbi:MAG: hypothetical protein IPH69_08060 [Bacteroidales bacterium]|nr:hypothetical protein [Bacteroidales bacterium]
MIKRLLVIFCLILPGTSLFAQTNTQVYDSVLAKRLGADERGMKSYILAILKTGSNKLAAGAERDNLFKGHFANINAMAESGKLVIAGPIDENEKTYRGIFILNVKTIDEAKELLKADPTISQKIFDVEYYEWYGSAAISEYLKVHKLIEKGSH